jgi:hypothetical protein
MQNQITTPSTSFLAIYTGPGGPISSRMYATNIRGARAEALADGRAWCDAGRDDLGLPPAASEDEVAEALNAGGWDLAYAVEEGFDIYSREYASHAATRVTRGDILARALRRGA